MEDNGAENRSERVTGEEGTDEEEEEMLKKKISGHPLYGLLLQTHINCLKVGLNEIGQFGHEAELALMNEADPNKFNTNNPTSSNLDKFMEGYCMALRQLKEVMERTTQEASAFIDAMSVQLNELTATPEPPSPPSPSPYMEKN